MNITFKEAVKAVYDWQYSRGDAAMSERLEDETYDYKSGGGSFLEILVHLYRKADPGNRALICEAWPEIPLALKMWEGAGDYGNDLFRSFKIGRFAKEGS